MTYEQAKTIVEWTAQANVGEVMRFRPDQILTALAVMALVQDNKTNP